MEKSLDWFKKKKVTASFAVISLIGGFLFLNYEITGNVILNGKYSFNFIDWFVTHFMLSYSSSLYSKKEVSSHIKWNF